MNSSLIHAMLALTIVLLVAGCSVSAAYTVDEWCNSGNNSYLQGHYDDALFSYEQALKLSPDNTTALSQKAMVFARLGRYDDALNVTNAAIDSAKKGGAQSITAEQLKEQLAMIEGMKDSTTDVRNSTRSR